VTGTPALAQTLIFALRAPVTTRNMVRIIMQLGPGPIAPGSAGADPRYNSPASEEQTTLEPKTQASRPSLDYAAGAIFGVITLAPNDFAEKEGR
jgi:hypothetical protein